MIFNVPIEIEINGTRVGKTRRSTVRAWEYTEIDIPFVMGDDAPVAVSWCDRMPEDFDGLVMDSAHWGAVASDGMQHTRFHGGSHWRPVLDVEIHGDDRQGTFARADVDDLAMLLDRGGLRGMFHTLYFGSAQKAHLKAAGGDLLSMFDTVEYSSRHLRAKDAAEIADDLLAVNGRLYRRCDEPRIILFQAALRKQHASLHTYTSTIGQFLRVVTDDRFATEVNAEETYPISQFDTVLAEYMKKNKRTPLIASAARSIKPEVSMADLLDPSHAAFRTFEHAASRFIRIYETVGGIADQPNGRLRAFCDIRDAFDSRHEDDALTRFEVAAQAFIETADQPGLAYLDGLIPLLRRAVEAIESRDIPVDRFAASTSFSRSAR